MLRNTNQKEEEEMISKLSSKLALLTFLCFFCVSMSVTAEEYVINPGDAISVSVWGHEQYTQTTLVRPDGRISYPFLGEIKVDGLSTTELSAKIRQVLLKYLIDPQVTVVITQPKMNKVFVLGQVGFPSQLRFENDQLDLLKALSMAGGTLDDTADLHSVKIIRDDGTSEIVDLEQLLASKPQRLVFLSPGDLVYVPGKERVSVTGYVLSPGQYKTRSSLGIVQALALAGGPMPDTADLSNTLVIRSTGEVVSVKLDSDLWASRGQSETYALNPGDALYVPNAYKTRKISVLGYVRQPGQYSIKGPVTLLESLALAGGIADVREAELERTRIIRDNGEVEQVNLSALKEAVPEDLSIVKTVMLHPGDMLEVYPKRKLINWSLALTVVSVLSIVSNMVYAVLK